MTGMLLRNSLVAGLAGLALTGLALVACGGAGTPASGAGTGGQAPGSPPSESAPASPDAGTPATGDMQTVRLQITHIDVLLAQSQPVQASLRAEGWLPDSCTEPRNPTVTRTGNDITVELPGERPVDRVCAQMVRPFEQTIPLGALPSGQYNLQVNDQQTTFTVP